jgi:hypothetical protein
MKKAITILLLSFIVVGLESCQSEYAERMENAIALKRKYMEVKDVMNESNNINLIKTLEDIENEINFHAKVSGNEELFLKEVWKNHQED